MDTQEMVELIARVDERTSCIPEMKHDIGDMKLIIAKLPTEVRVEKMITKEVTAQIATQSAKCQEKRDEGAKQKGMTIVVKWPPVKYIVGVVVAVGTVLGYNFAV